MAIKAGLVACALLLATPVVAGAATFNVFTLGYTAPICTGIQASGPKAAFLACWARMGLPMTAADAVVTAQLVCQSTHRIQQVGGLSSWAYDRRYTAVTRPGCPR